MYCNYRHNDQQLKLMQFICTKLNKNLDFMAQPLPISIFHDGTPERLLDEITINSNDNAFHIALTTSPSISKSSIPEWADNVRAKFKELGAEHFELISTALSTKNMLVLMFKYLGKYITLTSTNSIAQSDIYNHILAALLLECKDDKDLVLRITTAIQNSEELVYTKEDEELLRQAFKLELLGKVIAPMTMALRQERPIEKMQSITAMIEDRITSINKLTLELRQLELLDFAIATGQTDEGAIIEELKDYIMQSQDFILDADTGQFNPDRPDRPATLILTVQAYLYIPETDKDFFKPEAIKNEGHVLHNRPIAEKLLRGVMEQRIRIPITASYKIRIEENKVTDLDGKDAWYTDFRPAHTLVYLVNKHINYFNCFSGYRNMMLNAINKQKDPIMFFETMRQCTSSINVYDSSVINTMVSQFASKELPIQIKRDTGWENITVEEYINETTQAEQQQST